MTYFHGVGPVPRRSRSARALVARAVDALERRRGVRRERGDAPRLARRAALAVVDGRRRRRAASAASCGLGGAASERPAEPAGDAAAEAAGAEVAVDAGVDERHALGVGAVDAVGAQDGALDGDGGVRVDEALHAGGDVAGEGATLVDDGVVDRERMHDGESSSLGDGRLNPAAALGQLAGGDRRSACRPDGRGDRSSIRRWQQLYAALRRRQPREVRRAPADRLPHRVQSAAAPPHRTHHLRLEGSSRSRSITSASTATTTRCRRSSTRCCTCTCTRSASRRGTTRCSRRRREQLGIRVFHANPYPKNRASRHRYVYECPACGRMVFRKRPRARARDRLRRLLPRAGGRRVGRALRAAARREGQVRLAACGAAGCGGRCRGGRARASPACRSVHTSRLADGVRKRNAGWYVGMSGMPSYACQAPRSCEMGASERSRHCAANLPSATIMRGRMAASCFLRNGSHCGDLVGLGVAIAGRAALQDVADVDVAAAEAHRLDHLGQELAGGADERLAGAILVGAGRLADEDERRVGVADAVDDVGALAGAACSACSRRARRGSAASLRARRRPSTPARDRRRDRRAGVGDAGVRQRRRLRVRRFAARHADDAAALEPRHVLLDLARRAPTARRDRSCPPPRFGRPEQRTRAIEDAIGDLVLATAAAAARRCRRAPTARTRLVSVPKPRARLAHVVGDDEVAALVAPASRRRGARRPRSRRRSRPRTGARPLSSARMSGFCVSAIDGASPSASFFSFCGAARGRPIVGHRRRHHDHRRAVDARQHRGAHLAAPSRRRRA